MKKIVSFLLICLLLAGLMSGCKHDGGGSDTVQEAKAFYDLAPDDLVAEALRRFDALDSWSYVYDTSLDYAVFDQGPGICLDSSGEFVRQPLAMHGSFSDKPAEAQNPTEYYIREVEYPAKTVMEFAMNRYAKVSGTEDQYEWNWYYGKQDKLDASDPNISMVGPVPSTHWGKGLIYPYGLTTGTVLLTIADNTWRFLSAGESFAREDREMVNDRLAVRFQGTVSGKALYHLLNQAGCFGNQFMLREEDAPVQAGLPIQIWIDVETVLPLRIKLDFTGLMQEELATDSFREYTCRMLSQLPGEARSYEELLAQWDEKVSFHHGSVQIDLTPEPVEIVIPEDVAEHMELGH